MSDRKNNPLFSEKVLWNKDATGLPCVGTKMTPVGTKLRGDDKAPPGATSASTSFQLCSNLKQLLYSNLVPTLFQPFSHQSRRSRCFRNSRNFGAHFCGRSYWFQASSHEVLHLSGRQKVVWTYLIGWRLSGVIQAALSIDSASG